ncbi:MAG: hypothetical protein K8S13_00765 [Desulfobacula sp.]|uniref:hypothetical protein n=1 Tax=Desulfobacula sp. TaxID=2593537 RepID=UPI0025C12CA0|nr:hypothetical protein [Desulfobacula sp.]MCD4718379.1 hypothetical protein [Desulfobacula sp.]
MQIFKSLLIVISSFFCLLIILTTIAVAEEPAHPGYPFVFDATGKLDRISDKQLVIGDVLFKLSSSTTYHAPNTIFLKPSAFKKGDIIALILKDKNTREILSAWLIKKAD